MKGYVFVAANGIEADSALEHWVAQCLKFVESLPPK